MKKLVLIVATILFSILAKSQDKSLVKVYCDKSKSTITYAMSHPLHEWSGVCKNVTSVILTDNKKDKISKVAVVAKVSSFDSQNANRDSHTMEATEAIKYPNISFESKSIKQDGDKLSVTGDLTFHGVSQTVSFEANEKKLNDKIEFTGTFNVTLTQFKIDPPSLMGIASDDNITLQFDVFF